MVLLSHPAPASRTIRTPRSPNRSAIRAGSRIVRYPVAACKPCKAVPSRNLDLAVQARCEQENDFRTYASFGALPASAALAAELGPDSSLRWHLAIADSAPPRALSQESADAIATASHCGTSTGNGISIDDPTLRLARPW